MIMHELATPVWQHEEPPILDPIGSLFWHVDSLRRAQEALRNCLLVSKMVKVCERYS